MWIFGNQSAERTKIESSDLALTASALPEFLRFDKVFLCYNEWWPKSNLAQTEDSIVNSLQLLKPALNDANSIYFACTINRKLHRGGFRRHSQLISHLRHQLMPICDSARAYEFKIDFYSKWAADKNVIAQILQIPQINNCSNVRIDFSYFGDPFSPHQTQLPVEAISNWLHRGKSSHAGSENMGQNRRKRHLQIEVNVIQNFTEMCKNLKTVRSNQFKFYFR